jgi:intracellular sulfur oxidation DsrE/DsrF family protein
LTLGASCPRRTGSAAATWFGVLGLLLLTGSAFGQADEIAHLFERAEAPAGVVFEIVEGDEDALAWALPRVADHIQRLRARWPDLDVAVVAHGAEQFALERERRAEYADIHQAVDQLVAGTSATLHVCGAHAGWYGVGPEDFIDTVDVTPSGPAQINQYVDLGYEKVLIQE